MTRVTLSGTNAAEVVKPQLRAEYFCQVSLPSLTLRGNTGDTDVTFGGNTYLGNAKFAGFDKITETMDMKSRGVSIALSGLDSALIAAAMTDKYHNSIANLYVGFFNEANALIADPHQIGVTLRASEMNIELDEGKGQITLNVETLEVLNRRASTVLMTPESQKRRYAGDTGMDNVRAIAEADFEWGGKRYTSVIGGRVMTGLSDGSNTFAYLCPAPWVPVRLENGNEVECARLKVGDRVVTMDEVTLEPGAHEITAISAGVVERFMLVLTDGRRMEASASHPVYVLDFGWLAFEALSPGMRLHGDIPGVVKSCVPSSIGPVLRISIASAHTFMTAGILSHNKDPARTGSDTVT